MVWVAIIGCIALAIMGVFYRPLNNDLSEQAPNTIDEKASSLETSSSFLDVLKNLALFLSGFFIIIGLISALFASEFLSRNTVTERLSQSLITQTNTLENNIIIIDGGSYAHRAIDGQALETLLKRRGFNVTVFQSSLPGANHFERARLLESLLGRLASEKEVGKRRIVFLREAHSGYDTYPLNQVRDINDRVVGYAEPLSSWRQLKAMDLVSEESLTEPQKEAAKVLKKATAINMLGLGRLREPVLTKDLKPYPGYNPISKNRKPVTPATLDKANKFVENHILGPNAATGAPSSRAKKRWSWSQSGVSPKVDTLKEQLVDIELAYLPITTNTRDLRYFNSYCRDPKAACLFIDQDYADLLKSFDDDSYWTDPNHLSKKGADSYTTWLSGKIISQAGLVK